MRKHYLLGGVTLAVALAAAIVAVGVSVGGSSEGSGSAVSASLPPGHPTTTGKGGGADTSASGASVRSTIAKLEKALTADPGNVGLLLKLGDAYSLGQHYRQAERAYGQVLQLDAGNPTATVRLAMVWHADGDTARAEQTLKSLLVAAPDDQEAHYSMAIIYFSTDRAEAARKEWVIAAKLDPRSTIGRRSQSFVDLLEGKQSQSQSSD